MQKRNQGGKIEESEKTQTTMQKSQRRRERRISIPNWDGNKKNRERERVKITYEIDIQKLFQNSCTNIISPTRYNKIIILITLASVSADVDYLKQNIYPFVINSFIYFSLPSLWWEKHNLKYEKND